MLEKLISFPSAPRAEPQRVAALAAADDEGCTPVMLAAGAAGDALARCLEALGSRAPNEARQLEHSGATAMHFAASAGCVDNVAALFKIQHALLQSRDGGGATPLHLAAAEGQADAVTALLRLGASVVARDASGWTPLLYATGDAVLALLALQPEAQLAALTPIMATSAGEARAVKLLRALAEDPAAFAVLNTYLRCAPSALAVGASLMH